MPTIHIHSEEELLQRFTDLAHAVHNLRFYTKFWKEHYGYDAKKKMKHWEMKVDAELNKLGLTDHQRIGSLKIYDGQQHPAPMPESNEVKQDADGHK